MNIRELKDNSGVVFSPKVSTESVYLKNSTTNLESKLESMDTTISGKMNNVSLASVATSGSFNDLNNKPSNYPTNWLSRNDSLTYGANGLQFFDHSDEAGNSPTSNNNPTSGWHYTIRMNHLNSVGFLLTFLVPSFLMF